MKFICFNDLTLLNFNFHTTHSRLTLILGKMLIWTSEINAARVCKETDLINSEFSSRNIYNSRLLANIHSAIFQIYINYLLKSNLNEE